MKDTKLKCITPEEAGVPSEAVRRYIEALEARGVNLHSFLMMRGEKIFAEGYCPPYAEDTLQRMYSISKSFTSAAIGLMLDEGRIRLDSRIADYFQEFLPDNPHKWLLDTRVEDLLKMASPFVETKHYSGGGPWIKSYLGCPVNHPPGTVFLYDTAATYTLCALVERLSGKRLLDYMREKLLDPIGFSEDAWCVRGTDGYSWGGSGIMATLRDLAKFACVFNHGGRFEGKQLISEDYVRRATSKQIFNDEWSDNMMWRGGYGYQIWISDDGSFAFRGMGGQHAICFPKEDFIFCNTADCQGSDLTYQFIYEELRRQIIPKLSEPMKGNTAEYNALLEKCRSLKPSVVKGGASSEMSSEVNGAVYVMEDNPMKISELCFGFEDGGGTLRLVTPRGEKELHFGFGRNAEYVFPETHYFFEQIDVPSGKGYRTLSSAAWKDGHTLVIRNQTAGEYLGNSTMTFSFKGDEIGVVMTKTAEWFWDEYRGCAGGRKKLG